VKLCTELFYDTYIVSLLFANLLSLHLVTFLMFFFFLNLVTYLITVETGM